MRKIFLTAAGLAILAACAPATDLPEGEAGIAAFHQKLNAGDFDGIYQATSPQFALNTSRDASEQLMAAIHRKLGAFQSGSSASWTESIATSGHRLTINYSAQYERGAAMESFVYRFDGGKARLSGYHISSNALIVN